MVDKGVADGRIAQSCESTQQDPLVKVERCDQDASATIPAATEANKEPVATFSVAEIQEARSSLFRMAVPPGSGTDQHRKGTQQACESVDGKGLLRARLEDIIVDPAVLPPDWGSGPVDMSRGTVPKTDGALKLLQLGEWQGADRAAARTVQGSSSAKSVERYCRLKCSCMLVVARCLDSALPNCQDGVRRCKAPFTSQGEVAPRTGHCNIPRMPLECKKCLQQMWEQQHVCEHQSESGWRPGGPELNLREYTESSQYHGLSIEQNSTACQGKTRLGAVSGVAPQ